MSDLPKRKNIRLKDFDYSQNGAYFITICTKDKRKIFGDISNGMIVLSNYGTIAARNINLISRHIDDVYVDKYVVMPNHVHMMIFVMRTPCMVSLQPDNFVGTRYIVSDMVSAQTRSKQIIPKTVQQYKASVSRNAGVKGLWQSKYHDHIIRNEEEYNKIWEYIDTNPLKWELDCYFN